MATVTQPTKSECRKAFPQESGDLFNAAWRRVGRHIAEGYFDDPEAVIEQTISELVNDPKSRFYIHG